MANKVENEAALKMQLKTKRICRFCCSTTDTLSNIYSAENRIKSKAPLPLQVISIISIEVSYQKVVRIVRGICWRFSAFCSTDNDLYFCLEIRVNWWFSLDILWFYSKIFFSRFSQMMECHRWYAIRVVCSWISVIVSSKCVKTLTHYWSSFH